MLICELLLLAVAVVVSPSASESHYQDHADYDLEPNYELEFLQNHAEPVLDEHPIVIHENDYENDYEPEPEHEPASHIDEPHPEMVRDRWEHRLGDVVEGGYTVQEPDGTVHRVRYTENKGSAARRAEPQGYTQDV